MNGSQSIEQRMERLERENRRWRMGAVVLLVLAAGVAAAPQQKSAPQIVWAQKVVTEGRPLMRVGLVGNEPRLETYDVKKQVWTNWVSGVVARPIR